VEYVEVSLSIYTRLPWDEDTETQLAAEVAPDAPATSSPDAPAVPTVSPPDAPAPQKKWKPITYDPDERRSAVKKSQPRASYSFVKGRFKEKRNPYHMRA
jgi:hypothetical protein